jgi:hypothetical protein
LASAFATIASSSGGSDGLIELGAGAGACMIWSASAFRVWPVKGSLPVTISNSMTPSENRSVR